MKARTRSQKLKRKRGRPRLPATNYQPNGKPSRRKASLEMKQLREQELTEAEKVDNISVAALARARHNGIAPEQAADPRYGYELGRLFMADRITKLQYEAGMKLATDMARYYGLTGVPFPSARAQNLFAVRGEAGESEGKQKAARLAGEKARRLQALLLAVGDNQTAIRIQRVVLSVVVSDAPLGKSTQDNMLLRRGLNAMISYYGMEG